MSIRRINFQRWADYDAARRIDWRGEVFNWSNEFASQITLAAAVLRGDGPFPAISDEVRCVVGDKVMTLRRGDVDELLVLALEASVRALEVIKAAKEDPNGPPA
ncbi:MAG TPA: hypothetical protein DCL48_15580 [Alphaproteobacteria bacterium]|nr:hypothetical protein [Alphaproteobacteria bacterium]